MTPQAQTKVKVERNGSLAVLRFEGDVTSTSKDVVLGTYEKLSPETEQILLDFSKVQYLNSSGIALIIQLLIEASKAGRKVQTFGLTPHFQKSSPCWGSPNTPRYSRASQRRKRHSDNSALP